MIHRGYIYPGAGVEQLINLVLLVAKITAETPDDGPAELAVWNVAIINASNWYEEKVKMLETVYNRIYVRVTESNRDVLLGGDFNAPKREENDGTIMPHGQRDPMYRGYPHYGTPYYVGESAAEVAEFTYRDPRQRAERNLFDRGVGEWGIRDAYWAATERAKRARRTIPTRLPAVRASG